MFQFIANYRKPINNWPSYYIVFCIYNQTCVQRPPLEPKKQWLLLTGGRCSEVHLRYKSSKWDLKILAIKGMWSLFGGGGQLRFGSIQLISDLCGTDSLIYNYPGYFFISKILLYMSLFLVPIFRSERGKPVRCQKTVRIEK